MNEKDVGRRLRQLRIQRGMTIDELRKKTGVSIAQISRLETGKHSLLRKNIVAFAKALKVPPGYFFTEEDQAPVKAITGKPGARAPRMSKRLRRLLGTAGFLEFAEKAAAIFKKDGERSDRLWQAVGRATAKTAKAPGRRRSPRRKK